MIVREERELLGWDNGWKDRWKGSGRGSWGAGGGVEGDKVYVTFGSVISQTPVYLKLLSVLASKWRDRFSQI